MQVSIYISDLLYRHDCVVIPGFGAILSRRVPAQHFASSHTMYPPKKGLSFNAQITQNDGLLVNYMASVEQIPYEQALQDVRNYVRFLDREIDEKGAITIHKVGRFYRNSEQSIQFTPMYLVNYLPEAFGLASHETFAVDRSLPETSTAATALLQPEETQTPMVPLETAATTNLSWVRYAAAAALVIGVGYGAFKSYQSHLSESALLVEQLADAEVKAHVQEASFMIRNPLPGLNLQVAAAQAMMHDSTFASAPSQTFHVIAGAFRNPENADKKVAALIKLGYQAHRVGVNKYGLHKVAFASFDSRHAATNELIKLKAAGFTNAWLLAETL